MNRRPSAALAFILVLLAGRLAAAQPLADLARGDEPAAPLTLSWVEGRVDLARATGVEAAVSPDILDEGERLVVGSGRAELVADDGTLVHAGGDTDLWVEAGPRLRLVRGRLVVHTAVAGDGHLLATPAGLVRLEPAGAYDISARDLDGDTVIAVLAGRAAMTVADQAVPVSPDDVLTLDPRAPVARWGRGVPDDDFRAWSRRRADRATLARAAATLPPAVQPWTTDLAAHGTWSTIPEYGAVWFPTAGPAWRPYTLGSWRFSRRGWTWIDSVRWGWPVHHYGRWGRHATRGWYWIPQRRWAPAWVGWAIGPDHVAWSPLGWDSRPLIDFHAGLSLGPAGLWGATWAVAPRHAFGRRQRTAHPLEDTSRLPGPVLGGFVSQLIAPRGPALPGDRFAVPASFYTSRRALPPVADPPFPSPHVFPGTRSRVTDAPRRDDAPVADWRRPADAPARAALPRPVFTAPQTWTPVAPADEVVERQPRPLGPHGQPVEPSAAVSPPHPPSGRAAGMVAPAAATRASGGTREAEPSGTPPTGGDRMSDRRAPEGRRDRGGARAAAQPRRPRG